MQLKRALVWWYFRSAWWVTLPAAVIAAAYVITYSGRLAQAGLSPWLFIFVQSIATGWAMSRFDSPAAAYLYTRGFTRDRLWVNRIAGHLACVAVVWGIAAAIVWLGVRSEFQDRWIESPYYPLMKRSDFIVPLWWLVGYLALVGVAQYGPMRRAQPTVDRDAGYAIAVAVFCAWMAVVGGPRSTADGWMWTGLVELACTLLSIALLWGSWRLHRTLEVHP